MPTHKSCVQRAHNPDPDAFTYRRSRTHGSRVNRYRCKVDIWDSSLHMYSILQSLRDSPGVNLGPLWVQYLAAGPDETKPAGPLH
jgi:hypothetical protein